MNPTRRYVIIPYRVFEEYVTTDIVFPCFVWHGGDSYSYVLPEVEVVADVKVDKGQKSLYQISPRARYNMVAVPASAIPKDAIRLHMPRVDTQNELLEIYQRSPISSSTPLPDPIKGIDRNAVENATHLVKEGETIEILSRMYGVSTKDLLDINSSEYPKVGRYYNVFPEICFDENWKKLDYQNPGIGIIYNSNNILEIAIDFLIGGDGTCGERLQNMIVTGKAREQVQNWDEVQFLVANTKSKLIKRGCNPGDVETDEKKIGSLPKYVANSAWQNIKGAFGFHNEANDFWSPVHVLGSFNLTMRVNADGQTATVAVYDSKTKSSLLDNKFGKDINTSNGRFLEGTYQRYVWTIRLK